MQIIRAIVNSPKDSQGYVTITSEGIFNKLPVAVSNGINLRAGDWVFVSTTDYYNEPVIIGRCSGQLEISDLVDIINGLVKVINSNADTFDKHGHEYVSPAGEAVTSIPDSAGIPTTATPPATFDKAVETSVDKILY